MPLIRYDDVWYNTDLIYKLNLSKEDCGVYITYGRGDISHKTFNTANDAENFCIILSNGKTETINKTEDTEF